MTMILFPRHSLHKRQPDLSFQVEVDAATAAGFKTHFIDIEDETSFCHSNVPTLYRGWIVTSAEYRDMCVHEPNLIVTPEQYDNSYKFPEWYVQIRSGSAPINTPRSIYFPGTAAVLLENINKLWSDTGYEMLSSGERSKNGLDGAFDGSAIVIKDWCKGRKHEWLDACFIPDSSRNGNALRVISNFLNAQGESLAGGLVCRKYIPLQSLGAVHPKSKIPLFNEHRFFVFKGQIFYGAPYWDAGFYGHVTWPRKKVITDLVRDIKSDFFAIDIAKTETGIWTVIEVNDGGTAGIPEGGNVQDFYNALAEVF